MSAQNPSINLTPDVIAQIKRDFGGIAKLNIDGKEYILDVNDHQVGYTNQTTPIERTPQIPIAEPKGNGVDRHAELFNQYDADANKYMDYDEFKQFMAKSGIRLSEEQAKANFSYYDGDRDGKVSLDEFRHHVHFQTPAPAPVPAPVPVPVPRAPVTQQRAPAQRGTVVTIDGLFSRYAGAKGYLDRADVARFFAESGNQISDVDVQVHLKYLGATDGKVNRTLFGKFVEER